MKLKIIAEAGQGFEGKYSLAKKLLYAAIKANSDTIKYQLVFADEICTEDYSHYKFFKSLELKDNEWKSLKQIAQKNKIELQFDIFGTQSLGLCEKLNIKTVKIHPTDINNGKLLTSLKDSKIRNIILGVGGASYNEIIFALEILKSKKIILMFGFQGYPTPINANQLCRLNLIKPKLLKRYKNVVYGFADHEPSKSLLRYIVPAVATGIGFQYIEKHITLKTKRKLEDSESAFDPQEFKIFSKTLRESFLSIGSSKDKNFFSMSKEELNYRNKIRRHVITTKFLKKGKIIKYNDLTLKRSSEKNPLKNIDQVIGKKIKKNLSKNSVLKKNLISS